MLRKLCLPLTTAALLALTACGTTTASSSDATATSTPTSTDMATEMATGSASHMASEMATEMATQPPSSKATSAAGAAGSARRTINKTLTDPVMGNALTVEQAVLNFKPAASLVDKYPILDGAQVVLVKAKAKAGTKYYGTFGDGDIWITKTAHGIDVPPNDDLAALNTAVKAAGYSPILGEADAGKSTEGWAIFIIPPQAHVTLGLKRAAAATSDGKTISQKWWYVPLS